ncbi:MAG: hypothetical protein ACREBU_09905, partial [Nitrososphaera sp.]
HKEGTPLYDLRMGIESGFKDVLKEIGRQKGVEETEAITPRKGFKFQDECYRFLGEILKNQKHGDLLDMAGAKRGEIQGRIVGDLVITLGNGAGKIVIELKDVKKGTYSMSKIHSELDEAMKNRNAAYGVFVVKNVNSIDASNGYFQEYDSNKLVCALGNSDTDGKLHSEILFIAYRWARLRLALEHFKQQKKLDTAYVNERMKLIKTELREFDKIITRCGTIERSAGEIEGIATSIRRNIDREIGFILELLEGNGKQERMKLAVKK